MNYNEAIVNNIDTKLLREQIAVLTHVRYNRKCSVEEADILEGLLSLVENIQDQVDPNRATS